MKRFVNSNLKTYYHEAVEEFSDTSRFLTSGLAKGHNTMEYSWVADMLFKSTGNLSLNPHVAYISFFSDKDIMYQEFGNVQEIYDTYSFFSYITRSIFADVNFELDTKQYFKIGQKYSEFDLIEYINASEFISNEEGSTPYLQDGYRKSHEFYRAPVFHAEGYKLDLDQPGDPNEIYETFDKYLWAINGTSKFAVDEYSIELDLASGLGSDLAFLNRNEYDLYEYVAGVDPVRIMDYKINVDNPKYTYFDSGLKEWVTYYNDTNHYESGSFSPYVGSVIMYSGDNWEEYNNFVSHYLLPQVIINGVLEPAKIITSFPDTTTPAGRLSFNNGNHLNDSKDQSRVVYSTCKYMFTDIGAGTYELRRTIDGFRVFTGIDIDTERNRRYSAVVTTEPYFVVEPLGSGQLVDYSFVDKDGNQITDTSDARERFLKVKAPLNIISEIDNVLSQDDVNTDIINVLTIKGITATSSDINSSASNFYDKFKDSVDDDIFFSRQEACLDDLVGGLNGSGVPDLGYGIVGDATHKLFWMDAFGVDASKYSDSKIKVCGLGVSWEGDSSSSTMNLNIYCTNYAAVNSPQPGTSETPTPNSEVEFLENPESKIDVYSGSERFKPMIKLQGMNGYVKIMNKNTNYSINRASDGKYEIIYNVEFPYCPGSLNVRGESLGVITGFIYKKKSYINAGSQEVDATLPGDKKDRFNAANDRYVPYGDDSFCKTDVFFNLSSSVATDPFNKGGGKEDLNSTESKQLNYPGHLVWVKPVGDFLDLFSLTKSRFKNFKRYGTYELGAEWDNQPEDLKIFCLVDNRQWKFNEDKFSSYIGYENPSYVFDIDMSVISEDFRKYQASHGSIPDTKRWLYGYFTGFAHVLLSQDLDNISSPPTTEKLNTMGNNSDCSGC